ncbi:hypothetical protein BgAZ_205350 [Babesia gibsoni]|uniref:Uncharacterized protein n=1 Tax=Babesia gibsoni TaxID=33632 RepID=A0AAD8PDZ7_BABGI|nr:hypothetical protein BgAZ_205350 [Babesia gibsoni]
MEDQQHSPASSPKAKRGKTAASEKGASVERELDEEEKRALNEVEAEISKLLSNGIKDGSILGNEKDCAAVWKHIQAVYSDDTEEESEEFGVDKRLKDVIRAYSEGSTLRMSELIQELRKNISLHCKDVDSDISDLKFSTLIPVFLDRKTFGEPFSSPNTTDRMESTRAECLWIWECPSLDVFPQYMQERMKMARDSRNLVHKRYKALLKVKDAIKRGDQAAVAAANEQLGAIYRKVLLEKERREKMEAKRAVAEPKAQPITSIFSKVPMAKEQKQSKISSPVRQHKSSAKMSANAGSSQPSLLLSWLKSVPSSNASSSGDKNISKAQTKEKGAYTATKTAPNKASVNSAVSMAEEVMGEYEGLGAAGNHVTELSEHIAKLPYSAKNGRTSDGLKKENRDHKAVNDGDFESFKKVCENHREAWMRYFTYMNSNRRFFVETSTNRDDGSMESGSPKREQVTKSFLVDDIINNIVDAAYGDPALRQERHPRVFHMSDNDWKRPSMRLLISRSSNYVKPTDPMAIESVMDYFNDSDEDWFEQYDVDDVDESGSEEEEEEEEENDWIVQDNQEQGVQKHTQNLCEVVKVYCVNKNWHWIIDGIPQNNEECCSIEEAKNNGMNITTCDYGFGYEGYTTNPITDFVSGMRGNRVIMTTEDVQDFLKYCHAKHTKKEDLIAEFKELKPFCSTSEMKEKFKKYICRMKVDTTRQRWLVTTEAALLFGIRDELDAILAKEMEEVAE